MDLQRAKQHLREDLPAAFLALRRKDVPLRAKWFAGLAVAYALSPIDLVPDFIPVLGCLDDLLLLPLLVWLAVRSIPPEVWDQCRRESAGLWEGGKPRNWLCALPILAVWGIVLALAAKALLP